MAYFVVSLFANTFHSLVMILNDGKNIPFVLMYMKRSKSNHIKLVVIRS